MRISKEEVYRIVNHCPNSFKNIDYLDIYNRFKIGKGWTNWITLVFYEIEKELEKGNIPQEFQFLEVRPNFIYGSGDFISTHNYNASMRRIIDAFSNITNTVCEICGKKGRRITFSNDGSDHVVCLWHRIKYLGGSRDFPI